MPANSQTLSPRLAALLVGTMAALALAPVQSQPPPEDREIAELTRKLAKTPRAQYAAQLYADRAEAYRAKSDFTRTEQDARAALRLDPLNGDAHVELGSVYYQQDKDEQALAEFSRAVELQPFSAWCREVRALAYLDLNQPERAVADFKEAIRLDPQWSDAYVGLGRAYAARDETGKALVQFEEAISKNPKTEGAYSGRAQILKARGLYEKALHDMDLALRYDRPGPLNFYVRAEIYQRMGRKDLAAADFGTASRKSGPDSGEEQFRGKALAVLGQPRAALAAFGQGLDRFPRSDRILNDRAWLEATHPEAAVRSGARALRDATRACEISHWRDAASIDTLAAACAETGDYAGAIKYAERALPLARKSTAVEIQKHLEFFRRHQPWREDPTTYLPPLGGE